jgi:Fe-S cluster assembly protein SufD
MSLTTTEKNITTQIAGNIQKKFDGKLNAERTEALEYLQQIGFPSTKHEEFKHTPLTREIEKNFTFAGTVPTIGQKPIDDFFVKGFDAYVIVFINGVYSKEHSSIDDLQAGVTIASLKDSLETNPTAQQHFAKYVNNKQDAYTAWNAADWSDGLFIAVKDNVVVEKPIVIYHINNSSSEVAATNRNLIVTGTSSELSVIEKFDSHDGANHFLNIVTEVFVSENAGFNLYSIQNDEGNRYQYGLTQIYQKNASRVNTYTFTLNGKLIRNNLQLALDGEGIESHMYGLYLLHGETIADNHTVVDHKKPNSFSNEFYKGVMDDNSKGVFNGKIYVRPDAQKTNAFQANRNILMSDRASVNTKPQLEIWADDVKCSHGCTSGQLDEEAVFYLQTRGIRKETAKAMMLYAFAAEVLDNVKHPQIKEYLDALVSERLHKNF